MSQPSREAEIADMESRGYHWDGSEWVKLPKMTASDLDLVLSAYDRKSNHYRVQKIIHKDEPNEVAYANKMLKKIDRMVVQVIARFHNQDA